MFAVGDTILIINIVTSSALLLYAVRLFFTARRINKDKARFEEDAARIIENARIKSQQVMYHSENLNRMLRAEAKHGFQEAVDDIKAENVRFYSDLEFHYAKVLKQFIDVLSKNSESSIKSSMDELRTSLRKSNELLDVQIGEMVKAARLEVEEYKHSEKEKFQQHMEDRVGAIIKAHFPDVISMEDHQKLIKESIEEAYNQSLFS